MAATQPHGVGRGAKGRGKGRGQSGGFHNLPQHSAKADIDVFVSYSLSGETVTVPACGPRRMRRGVAERVPVDLAFDRLLAPLQRGDGGFPITEALISGLGLSETQDAMKYSGLDCSPVVGTLLVMLTFEICKPMQSPLASHIVSRATDFLASSAAGALEAARRGDYSSLPGGDAIKSNFQDDGQSRYTLWATLARMTERSWQRGTIVCPRYILVELGAALVSHYDVDVSWQVVVERGVAFFSRGDSFPGDWMRQGYVFEAAVVDEYLAKEDRLLAELRLPRCNFVYSAAPDAVTEDNGITSRSDSEAEERVVFVRKGGRTEADNVTQAAHRGLDKEEAGDHENEEEEKDQEQENIEDDRLPDSHVFGSCATPAERLVCAVPDANGATKLLTVAVRHPIRPRRKYVEVKKTTHLHGRAGDLKRLRYWLQARLADIQHVVVGCTLQEPLVVNEITEFSTKELAPPEEGRLWSGLDELGASLQESLRQDGEYLVTLSNEGGRAVVSARPGPADPGLVALASGAMGCFAAHSARATTMAWLDPISKNADQH